MKPNKYFLFSLIFFASFLNVTAQKNIALHGGVNYSNFSLSDVFENESRLFIFGGITAEFELSNKLNFNSFIQYSQKGTGTLKELPVNSDLSIRLHYLDIVPNLEYNLIDFFGIYTGANLGYLLWADFVDQNGDWQKIQDSGFFEKTDFGLVFGTKIYFGNISIHTHWNQGLKTISSFQFTDPQGNILSKVISKNKSLQVGLTLHL